MKKWDFEQPVWVNILSWVIGILLVLGLVFGLLCLEGWLIMLLWNAIIPVLFVGVGNLWYWGAFGLILLCNILFKTTISIKDNND